MKKVLLTLMFIVGLSTVSFAQIQIEENYDNDLIIIGNISGGGFSNAMGEMAKALNGTSYERLAEHKVYCRIFKGKTTFGILIDTESAVDDDFEFALGTDIFKARESINTIFDFMKNNRIGKSINVKDEDGRIIQIHFVSKNKIKLTILDGTEIIYDNIYLMKNNLVRADALLEKDAMKKVNKVLKRNEKHLQKDE